MESFSFFELLDKLDKNSEKLSEEEIQYVQNSFTYYLSSANTTATDIVAE